MYPHVPHQDDQPILDISHLSVSYEGRQALEDITFHLDPGERVAVVGPNGAGKSTLLKVVAGVLRPSLGKRERVWVGTGKHVCISYIPQRSQVDWRFPVSVADVVMMGRIAKLGCWAGRRSGIGNSYTMPWRPWRWTSMARRQIGQLSGGQQQRMFIARAMAQEAELMLMDEPLTGLDTPSQEGLLNLLDELRKKRVTVMLSTHDLEQAARYFDRTLLLNHKLIALGQG